MTPEEKLDNIIALLGKKATILLHNLQDIVRLAALIT